MTEPSVIPGRRIGRFAVLELLGRGGMASVVAAYDEQLDRRVAVKVVLPSRVHDKDDQRRLWREAQALARLSHPNVVTVHDVGRHEGGVFVAMEFIRGRNLSAWQRTEPSWKVVLHAYIQAGRGLAAAHKAEIVHRDFKPHNVMRTDDGAVKVLDFGLACGTLHSTTDVDGLVSYSSTFDAVLTQPGSVMGTPPYMAPEQHDAETVDARSDQYGFCIALWEGLTGTRPFSGNNIDDLLRAKLGGAPPWPKGAPPVPRPVIEALRRGLSPDAEARWPSMDQLLLELQVHDKPRRRRLWTILSGGTLLAVGGAMTHLLAEPTEPPCTDARAKLSGIWDDTRSEQVHSAVLDVPLPFVPNAWERAEVRLDQYANAWVDMHTEACEATAVRSEQSPHMLDLRMACLNHAALSLEAAVETLSHADRVVVRKLGALVGTLPPLSRCADTKALLATTEPPLADEAEAVIVAKRWLARAKAEYAAGRPRRAQSEVERARRQLANVDYPPVHVELALVSGDVLTGLGEFERANEAFDRALELAIRERLTDEVGIAALGLVNLLALHEERLDEGLRYWPLVRGSAATNPAEHLSTRIVLSDVLLRRGKYEEAENELRAAIAAEHQSGEGNENDLLKARNHLGTALRMQGKYEEAEDQLRSVLLEETAALGPEHPTVAATRDKLGNVLHRRGKYEEAAREHQLALTLFEEALGSDHPNVANARNNLGNALATMGRLDEAEVEFRAAVALRLAAFGPDNPTVARTRCGLGNVLQARGELEEAEAQNRACIAGLTEGLGPDHVHVARARSNLGTVLQQLGRVSEAESEYRAAIAVKLATLGPEHPVIAETRTNLGVALATQGKYEEAEREYRAALEVQSNALGLDHPQMVDARSSLAQLFSMQGKYEEAEAEHRAILASTRKTQGDRHPNVAIARHDLGVALAGQGRNEEALHEFEAAFALRNEVLEATHPDVTNSRLALAEALLHQGRQKRALALLRDGWTEAAPTGADPNLRARTALLLAKILWTAAPPDRDRPRARTLVERALLSLDGADADQAATTSRLQRWLDRHSGSRSLKRR